MRRNLAITLMISAYALTVQSAASWEKSGPAYEKQSAQAKESALWKDITSDQNSYGWYSSLSLGGLFTESMMPSISWVGDTFENGWLGIRKKLIHSVGNTATCKFVPAQNSEGYTGIFASGADHGIIRLSAAKEPDMSSGTEPKDALDKFMPGFGLKFLRDGVKSGNLVAMYGVDGAESWNFFRMDFSNHVPDPTSLPQKILGKKFATATPFIQYVGLSDIARFDQHGKEVANPKFPFQLVFEPLLRESLPDYFDGTAFTDQLAAIAANTHLYKVYAYAEPDSARVHIGDLHLTSKLVTSKFGDQYLFFKHQDMQEDIAIRPEWKSHLKVGSSRCPVTFIQEVASELFQTFVKTLFRL